jgi:malonyl CoA-acyl carrier protein transacylase
VESQAQVSAEASQAQVSAEALMEQLREKFEQLCRGVAGAVNGAPAGQVINASEEEVRDLLAEFRKTTYQAAVQLRLEAAQAASPPSGTPQDR